MTVDAATKDAIFQASIEFIGHLTGMTPPPIETAPAATFKPFKDFTDRICEIFDKQQDTFIYPKSFGEKYPRNPDAKCKCEHWQACIDCHPSYIEAALKGEV